jgi:hypothetical protein
MKKHTEDEMREALDWFCMEANPHKKNPRAAILADVIAEVLESRAALRAIGCQGCAEGCGLTCATVDIAYHGAFKPRPFDEWCEVCKMIDAKP